MNKNLLNFRLMKRMDGFFEGNDIHSWKCQQFLMKKKNCLNYIFFLSKVPVRLWAFNCLKEW